VTEPGLSIRLDAPPESDVSVDGNLSLLDFHQRLLEAGLEEHVRSALLEIPGDQRADYRTALRNVGVDALDGKLATIAASCREIGVSWPFIDALRDLGTGSSAGLPSGLDDILNALPPLLASAGTTPTILVRLSVGWAGRRPQQREDLLEFAARLALGCDVTLVCGEVVGRRLRADHADLLPGHCLTDLCNRRRASDGPVAADRAERVDDALGSLEPDARPVAILSHLSESPTHSLRYDRLADRMALDQTPSESLRRLDDLGLVDRTDRADGSPVASLRPSGLDTHRALDRSVAADGGRASAGGASASTGVHGGASGPPQISPDMPCWPDGKTDPEDPPPADAPPADARPDDRRERYQHGLIAPEFAKTHQWVPAVEGSDTGEVVLQDADLDLNPGRDGRRPWVSFDAETDTVWCAGDYSNPMQFAALLAHGLTCEELIGALDLADRIGDRLEGLEIKEKPVLWWGICTGWLPSDVDSGGDWVSELRGARDDLLELCKALNRGNVERSTVTRHALGLIGTMTAIFDLLGLDCCLEARIPQFSRHFSDSGNSGRREDLVENLGMLSALSTRVGAFNVFRQAFEDRTDERQEALTPGFASKSADLEGSMGTSLIVVGDGVEGLADDLEDDLAPRPQHADAPPIGASVDVLQGVGKVRSRSVVRRMLRKNGLDPSRSASCPGNVRTYIS